jgi:hypothetical protein
MFSFPVYLSLKWDQLGWASAFISMVRGDIYILISGLFKASKKAEVPATVAN